MNLSNHSWPLIAKIHLVSVACIPANQNSENCVFSLSNIAKFLAVLSVGEKVKGVKEVFYTRGTSLSRFMNSVLFYFKKAKKVKQILAGMTLFI